LKMEPTPKPVPTFKTFVNSEPQWKALMLAAMLALSEATSPAARQASRDIFNEKDCRKMRKKYRKYALQFFPRTLKDTKDKQKQEDAVAITRAYDLRNRFSCERRRRQTKDEEQKKEEESKPE